MGRQPCQQRAYDYTDAEAEGAAFDHAILLSKWRDVLDSYKLVLWLPAGSVPGSVTLTARQAVGLSDIAAKHRSGMVAFTHSGSKITLSREVAASLRARLEEKLDLQSREVEEDSREPILIITNGPVPSGRRWRPSAAPTRTRIATRPAARRQLAPSDHSHRRGRGRRRTR